MTYNFQIRRWGDYEDLAELSSDSDGESSTDNNEVRYRLL